MLEKNWDKIWKECKFISDYNIRLHAFFENYISKTMSSFVLEAGCGSGETLKIFDSYNQHCFGLDISDVALEKTKKNSAINITKGDILHLPFQNETFDLVYNSGVIEHFPYPKNIMVIKEMKRVVKVGGKIIIIIPNKLCLWYIIGKYFLQSINKWPFGYEESYSPWQLELYIQEVGGLKVEKYIGLQVFPPLASHNFELVGIQFRKHIAQLEKYFPYKFLYAYGLGALCSKVG